MGSRNLNLRFMKLSAALVLKAISPAILSQPNPTHNREHGRTPLRAPFYCALLLLLVSLAGPLAAQSVDNDIAMKFYPTALDDFWADTHAPGSTPHRIAKTLRVDLDKTGLTDYVAAAYSNGTTGAFRIIRGTDVASAVLVTEATGINIGGDGRPAVEAVDIDNDGVPELALEFRHATWLFKYTNGSLVLFGPSRMGRLGPTTNLGAAAFLDVDGDGILDILELSGDADSPYVLHKLDASGTFVTQPDVIVFADQFVCPIDQPTVETRTFTADPTATYSIRIISGDQSGLSKVNSAAVTLNSVTVIGGNDLTSAQPTLAVPVPLTDTSDNTLTVALSGSPGSVLTLVIVRQ